MSSMRSASSRTSVCKDREADEAAIEEIFQASGRGHDQASALANGVELRAFGQSADNQGRRWKLLAAQLVVLFGNLHGQFPCGNEHKRRTMPALLAEKPFNDGNQERQGLAGTGLSGSHYIFARMAGGMAAACTGVGTVKCRAANLSFI